MNERELRQALRNVAIEDDGARERSWRVVRAAYAGYEPRAVGRRRPRWTALVVAAALLPVAAAGAAAATAPESGVGHWVRDVLGVGERDARPGLVRLPGGGKLLVESGASAWVVSSDGSKRRLGAYAGASWSPRGLFLVAWRGRELTAIDPDGQVRWSLARPQRITAARWGPVDGFRVAYLAGSELRIVNGDGSGDHRYGAARRQVAPAWRPDDTHVLAYVDTSKRVNVVAVDSRRLLWRSEPETGLVRLRWSPRGDRLLAVTRRRLVLFHGAGRRSFSGEMSGFAIENAEWSPSGSHVAVVRHSATLGRSDVLLLSPGSGREPRLLFTAPGRLGRLAWSPDGSRLLVSWPQANQWLFLRPRGEGRLTAVANIASQFMPGTVRPEFPRSFEWCCTSR